MLCPNLRTHKNALPCYQAAIINCSETRLFIKNQQKITEDKPFRVSMGEHFYGDVETWRFQHRLSPFKSRAKIRKKKSARNP